MHFRLPFVATLRLVIVIVSGMSTALAQGSLEELATLSSRTSHRASTYDRSGGNLDNVVGLAPGEVYTLLDTDGPGKLTHLWMTLSYYEGHEHPLRDIVIRYFWEGSEVPSVEVPLGDFFGLGHGLEYRVGSAPVRVGSNMRALNCYWPMPFYKHARVEIVNRGERSVRRIYINLSYELGEIPAGQGLFHARFHREKELQPQPLDGNTHGKNNYVLLDTKGEGQYVGCFLFVDSARGGWWGEGDEMIFLEGEEKPSIVGTGTEDYFGNAWGFQDVFNYPYYGTPLLQRSEDGWRQTTVYRFHIPDPVRFKKQIRVTLEPTWPGGKAYDYSSVAFWYQREVAQSPPPLPGFAENRPRKHGKPAPPQGGDQKRCATHFEPQLRARGVAVRAVTTELKEALGGGTLQIDPEGKRVDLVVPNVAPGKYHLSVKLHQVEQVEEIRLGVAGGEGKSPAASSPDKELTLGMVRVDESGEARWWLESSAPVQVDYVRLQPE